MVGGRFKVEGGEGRGGGVRMGFQRGVSMCAHDDVIIYARQVQARKSLN